MNYFFPIEQQKPLEIIVSERIKIENLKKFLLSSFKINNINLENKDKVFTTFIEEINEYQIFILKEDYKYFEFQVFEIFYKNIITEGFDLYLCEEFFCLYKNGLFYYSQNFKLNLPMEEFVEFLNKKFQITINSYKIIDEIYLKELRETYINDKIKTSFNPINLKNDYSFYLYLFYVFTLIFCFLFVFLEQNNLETKEIKNENSFEELKNSYKFQSFYEKLDEIFSKIHLNNLELISYEFKENSSKVVLNGVSKEKIYSFLEENKKNLLSSSINFIENKNLYEAVLYVRVF